MVAIDYSALMPVVVDISMQAGGKILEVYRTDFSVQKKDDKSPLTAADMAAHNTIVEGLEGLTPTIPVLSEESVDVPFAVRSQWQTYWLVDPMDGTREFVKRNGEFTVNIALIESSRPTMGVIYAPVLDTVYAGAQGLGSWKQEDAGGQQTITVRELPEGTLMVVGSRSHHNDMLDEFLQKVGDYHLIGMGSSLKSCLIAEGKADIYPRFGATSEWDTAAAQAIVEGAGGSLVTMDMQPMRYNMKESLLNPHFMVIADMSRDWASLL